MDAAGLATLGDEAESKYERLRAADATAREVARLLEREGVDVAALEADFVSYGVVRTHITDCLGAEYEPATAGDWERETIDSHRSRARRSGTLSARSGARATSAAASRWPSTSMRPSSARIVTVGVPLRRTLGRGYIYQCRNAAGGTSDD